MTLTDAVDRSSSDRYQIHTLLRTLNGLGFDVAELTADSADGGSDRSECGPRSSTPGTTAAG